MTAAMGCLVGQVSTNCHTLLAVISCVIVLAATSSVQAKESGRPEWAVDKTDKFPSILSAGSRLRRSTTGSVSGESQVSAAESSAKQMAALRPLSDDDNTDGNLEAGASASAYYNANNERTFDGDLDRVLADAEETYRSLAQERPAYPQSAYSDLIYGGRLPYRYSTAYPRQLLNSGYPSLIKSSNAKREDPDAKNQFRLRFGRSGVRLRFGRSEAPHIMRFG